MRLEKIILDGFKSFADKTEFIFDSSVTAIVGPNGCGKSNVVDGVKWVLGEQRLKSLRSDQMADVIFGGSGGRKAMDSAEVVLCISNRDGPGSSRLPIDADGVQISRRVYRNGECEYRINNKICRLKDVRELFMDTGVCTRAYSIIEQGQIEQLLSASKTDRRLIFEEAAGISKYKAHKKEALRKLERTEQNLLRLADILAEVTKRLRSVKLQAGKARSYLQYTQRLKELQVNYSLVEYAQNRTKLQQKQATLEETQGQYAQLVAEITKTDTSLSKLGDDILDKEHLLSEMGNSLIAVQSKIEQRLQRIDFLRARVTELQQMSVSERRRVESLQEQRSSLQSALARHKDELASCERILKDRNLVVEQVKEEMAKLGTEITHLQADIEDEKSGIIDIVRRTAQLHNEIQSISVHRNNLSSQKDRLASRAQNSKAELERLLTEKAQYQARLNDVEKVLNELQQSLESKRKKIEQNENSSEQDRQRLVRSREVRSALNGELSVLTDMEKRCEGLPSAVKKLLQNQTEPAKKLDYIDGILAQIISTDLEYANAVEAALEGRTDSIIINNIEKLLADSKTISKLDGRVEFICRDRNEPFVDKEDFSGLPHVKGRLVEFVRYQSKYTPLVWRLLGKTIVVDTLEAVLELDPIGKKGYGFVTLDGQYFSPEGSLKLGQLGRTTGLISRRSRMQQLDESVSNISLEVAELEKRIEEKACERAHIERLCKELRTAIYEANTEKTQITEKLAFYQENIKRLKDEQPLIASEIELLENQISQSVQKEYDSKQKLQETEAVNNERTSRVKELETRCNELRNQRQLLDAQLTDLRVGLGQVAEQSKALKQIIENLQGQIQSNMRDADTAAEQVRTCSERLEDAKRDILKCETDVSELFLEKEKDQQNNRLLHEEVERLLSQKRQAENIMRAKQAEKDDLEQVIGQLKVELGQLEVKLQDLVDRVRDELQIDLNEAFKSYSNQDVDWDSVRVEITEIRDKIERLGNVNLDAIDEQESLQQRHKFLSDQVEDLNRSKAQLQQLINRLNKKSREKFSQTFEEIRGHFQQIFRKLFGGGKADVMLEDAEDILEAGIEIIARPPGKETRSITLLSGGEKSLTALSLLFAVFRTKPSPFCFLDEVDAALDEANNERFNLLLREFQKDTQFIIITHAKRTMSIADVLLGITMQTQGVSKKISVRFEEYEEEPAAA